MAGTLYLCATPIGNLEDMTFRAVRILKEADLIAAEDTRNSIKLLNHFEIKTPMTSYHEYNKIEKGHKLVERLQNGEDIAVITDAGMPGISDPGEELVKMCQEAGITVTAVPGACACVTALTISGLGTRRFAFEAFLPTDKKERQAVLNELKDETRTMVIYEAPHRLVRTLKTLRETLGNRRISICRELTKKHETVFATKIEDALAYYDVQEPKGECVMVIEGKSREEIRSEEKARWEEMSIEEHMELYLGQGMDKKSAMKQVAKDRGIDISVSSSATSYEEIGNDIHPSTKRVLTAHSIPFSKRGATHFEKEDYKNNDFILCMDSYNIKNLKRIIGADSDNKVHLLLEYGKNTRDISDPWYTGNFDLTYDDIVEGCEGFLDYLANNNLI